MRRRWALLHGGDDSLPALLEDVLSELGLEPSPGSADTAHLILVHVEGPQGLAHVERAVRRYAGRATVLALLSFADEQMREAALRKGARGVYALGTPLTHLRSQVRALLR